MGIMKAYQVKLNTPYNGKECYYFVKMRSITDTLPREVIGCALQNLRNMRLKEKGYYKSKLCEIIVIDIE